MGNGGPVVEVWIWYNVSPEFSKIGLEMYRERTALLGMGGECQRLHVGKVLLL